MTSEVHMVTCLEFDPDLERNMTVRQGLGKMLPCRVCVNKTSAIQTMLKVFTELLNSQHF